jgi:hypothetical protein
VAQKWLLNRQLDRSKNMFFKFLFRQWPLHKQVSYIKRKGVLIGSRTKDSRKIYIYMYQDHFVEIQFKNDSPEDAVENASIVKGLKNLNNYLEKEFKTNF